MRDLRTVGAFLGSEQGCEDVGSASQDGRILRLLAFCDKKHKVTLSLKDVLGYPLRRDFRGRLCAVPGGRQEATK